MPNKHEIKKCSHCHGSGREPAPVEPPPLNRLPKDEKIVFPDGRTLELNSWTPDPGGFSAHVRIGKGSPSPVSSEDDARRINRAIKIPPGPIALGDGRLMHITDWHVCIEPCSFLEVSGDFYMEEIKDD